MRTVTAVDRWTRMSLLTLCCALHATPSRGELYAPRSQRIQDSFDGGIEGFAFSSDHLGVAQAVGDFNGDGRDDLAIGEYESLTQQHEGAVHVLYGAAGGLSTANDVLLKDVDPQTGQSDREPEDYFGWKLAAGNFNGDAFDDLAIGIPFEDVGFATDAGVVLVVYGSPNGLVILGSPLAQRWRRGAGGVFNEPETGDLFGYALAAGDFDDDGFDDLAIGCPSCDAFTNQLPVNTGGVHVLFGSILGVTGVDDRYFDQDSSDPIDNTPMLDACQNNDLFGESLAVGDFDADGVDDLAVGVPRENFGAATDAGAVQVVHGETGFGLRISGNQLWRESNVVTGGVEESGDRFGSVLAAGDVTGDGVDDLAIGAPNEDVGALLDAGAVTLLWGQPGVGLDTPGSEIYVQSSMGDGQASGAFELFGFSLSIGDFVEQNAVGALDLAIGIVQEEVFDPITLLNLPLAGAVTIVPGGFGLDPLSPRYWFLGARGAAGGSDLAESSMFGYSLAAGDFNGDGEDDLSIGAIAVEGLFAPDVESFESGAVYVLYGALFADGFDSGTLGAWAGLVP